MSLDAARKVRATSQVAAKFLNVRRFRPQPLRMLRRAVKKTARLEQFVLAPAGRFACLFKNRCDLLRAKRLEIGSHLLSLIENLLAIDACDPYRCRQAQRVL